LQQRIVLGEAQDVDRLLSDATEIAIEPYLGPAATERLLARNWAELSPSSPDTFREVDGPSSLTAPAVLPSVTKHRQHPGADSAPALPRLLPGRYGLSRRFLAQSPRDRLAAGIVAVVARALDELTEGMPPPPAVRVPSEPVQHSLVGGIAILVVRKVEAGEGEWLPDLLPDLLELTLARFLPLEEALRVARQAAT
jgi:hypothetical protein